MSGPFGITDAGFIPKTQQDILSDFETSQRATIDPVLDESPDQPLGQLNGIFSRALAELYEIAKVAYDAFDPDKAEGDALTSLCKISGTDRNRSTYSTVLMQLTLKAGTGLTSGTHFVQITGNPDVRFTPVEDLDPALVAIDSIYGVLFRSENKGPVGAGSHTLTTIATPVNGWIAADNPNPADLGHLVDDDPTLRLRRQRALQATGSATVGAIRSDVLELEDSTGTQFVQSCDVFENTSDIVDSNGLPPHSFEVLVYDGVSPPGSQSDAIAQVIWNDRPAGIQAVGTTSGTAVDELGGTHAVAFSRAIAVPIYVVFTLSTGTGYVGATAVKQFVADFGNTQYNKPGKDVISLLIEALPLQLTGVLDVTSFAIGRAPGPSSPGNVGIGDMEIARFDTANISVTP